MKVSIVGSIIAVMILAGCGPTDSERAESKRNGFHCLSGYDGSHRGVEQFIKQNLRDPNSYEHVQTRITPVKDGEHTLFTSYRARNGFGGMTSGSAIATVNNETCHATILAQE